MAPEPDPDAFRAATEALLQRVADATGAVVLGRAGMVVLDGRADVLCVRLDGPVEARIAQAVSDGADPTTARQVQRDVDGVRNHDASFFYKVRQDDPRLYHLFIDTTALSIDACVDIIARGASRAV